MSLTFRSLPRKGNTPYLFLSCFDNPDITPALAESPSVRISVHSHDLRPPAHIAPVYLGMPLIFTVFLPSVFFAALVSLISVKLIAASITPNFLTTCSINLSVTVHFVPNLLAGVLR